MRRTPPSRFILPFNAILLFTLSALLVTATRDSWGCGGTAPPFFCGKTYVFSQAVPNANEPAGFDASVTVQTLHFVNLIENFFVNACPTLPGTVEMTAAISSGGVGAAGGSTFGPFPVDEGYTQIQIEVPILSLPADEYELEIISTVTFNDGSVLQQSTTQSICVVEPVDDGAESSSVQPRLSVECVDGSGGVSLAHPGDQRSGVYRIMNNDLDHAFFGSLVVESSNVADLPTVLAGENSTAVGPFSIADPAGDAFAIGIVSQFDGPCLGRSTTPHLETLSTDHKTIQLNPGEFVDVEVALRSYNLCAGGSCNQGVARVIGFFDDGSTTRACAGFVHAVDDTLPADFACNKNGRAATAASDSTPGFGPAVRINGDASPNDDQEWRINFTLDISSMDLLINGEPISGGTPNFSGVTHIDGAFGRLLAEFSFISPLAEQDDVITMIYTIRVVPDNSSPNSITPIIGSLELIEDAPNGFADKFPFLLGTIDIFTPPGGISPAVLHFIQQFSAIGVEDDGSFSKVEMDNLSATVLQLNGVEYQVITEWTATNPGPTPMLGFDVTNDFRGFAALTCGACDLPDGSCITTSEAMCDAAGGTYQGDDTECPPGGACDLPDGSCTETTAEDCADQGGSFNGGGTKCPPPQTGCCLFVDGSCEDLTAEECVNADGFPGEPGTSCAVGDCVGACCFPVDECGETFESICLFLGGTYLGNGTVCEEEICLGACCFGDGECVPNTAALACFDAGGIFQGVGSTCEPNPCVTACCFSDGSCFDLSSVLCIAQGGSPLNFGSTCSENTCTVAVGPCCLPNGGCIVVNATDCAEAGGELQGLGDNCAAAMCNPTPCCLPDRLPCVIVSPDVCEFLGGTPVPGATRCDDIALCETQACCFGDEPCEDLLPSDCTAAGGAPQGVNTSCGGIGPICPGGEIGACDLPDGTCTETTVGDCKDQGGTFNGGGTKCPSGNIPQACCISGVCVDLTIEQCLEMSGTPGGKGTECVAFPCSGACCLPDGMCDDLSIESCVAFGGIFLGFGSSCVGQDCLVACCLGDGTCIPNLTLNACDANGGTPAGINSTCEPNPCVTACCLPGNVCMELSLADCVMQGGVSLPFGTTCQESLCVNTVQCCRPNGNCIVESASDCAANGGYFLGFGTECESSSCDLARACCFDDNSCLVIHPDLCADLGGDSIFGEFFCEDTCEPQACCLPDGSCVDVRPSDCFTLGGTPQGPDTTCEDSGFGPICPAGETGSCDLPDGSCFETTPGDCAEQGGTYGGDGTTCPPLGPCCFFDTFTCIQTTQEDCTEQGGTYAGDGLACFTAIECFLPDDLCENLTPCDCLALGGIPHGPGTTCDPGPCCLQSGFCVITTSFDCVNKFNGTPLPATIDCTDVQGCILPDGSCETLQVCNCIAQGGELLGPGSDCATGGCCIETDFGIDCIPDLTEEQCAAVENSIFYLGDGTSCGVQACILPDGTCLNAGVCACVNMGGKPQGAGSACPVGACCVPGGIGGVCIETSAESCRAGENTVYLGDGTTCDAPIVACVFAGLGECIELTHCFCLDQGGIPQPPGSSCDTQGDLNGDGEVGGSDLGILLGSWGDCPDGEPCPADLNFDGTVDGADLGLLLGNWT